MNRHRRRANRKIQRAEIKEIPIDQLLNATKGCAWVGCTARSQPTPSESAAKKVTDRRSPRLSHLWGCQISGGAKGTQPPQASGVTTPSLFESISLKASLNQGGISSQNCICTGFTSLVARPVESVASIPERRGPAQWLGSTKIHPASITSAFA